MELNEIDVEKVGYRCVTFRKGEKMVMEPGELSLHGKSLLIKEKEAFVCLPCHERKGEKFRAFQPGYPLRWVYPMIRILFAADGAIIARRTGPGQTLIATKRGCSLLVNNLHNLSKG